MKPVKEQTVFRLLTFLLVIMLLVPATVKLVHVFEHHYHEVCQGEDSTHIHKVDLDCEFQKFSISHHSQLSNENFELIQIVSSTQSYNISYKFLNNYKPLSFSLRGPPHSS